MDLEIMINRSDSENVDSRGADRLICQYGHLLQAKSSLAAADADPLLLLAFGRGLPPPDPRRHFESAFTAGAERRVVSGSASGKEV